MFSYQEKGKSSLHAMAYMGKLKVSFKFKEKKDK